MYSRDDVISATKQLSEHIHQLEMVQNYQLIEKRVHENERLKHYMNHLKRSQKQSVNFQNYNKPVAYQQSEDSINAIKSDIDEIPIVNQFREAQNETNELLQLITKTLYQRLQENSDTTLFEDKES
ncbi:YlbF family regulator [Staphylococcus sp. 11261D007BR]